MTSGWSPLVVLRKRRPSRLVAPAAASGAPRRVIVTTFAGSAAEIQGWLAVQNAAFATEGRAHPWGESAFRRELCQRSWWSDQRLWLARSSIDSRQIVGTLALELTADRAQLHWLAVRPEFQRQGVARLLLRHAEDECWSHAAPWLQAETVRGSVAERFYRACGYRCAAGS